MAKPKELESIKLLVGDEEGRENTLAASKTPNVDSAVETQDAPVDTNTSGGANTPKAEDAQEKDHPRERKRRRGKAIKKGETTGICSKSPVVRLLDEEKRLLKRLEAYILLETGETVPDHQLIMDAVREYTKKHYPDFK